jgi:perosamine synthetase
MGWNLLPVELWDYRIGDVARNLPAAFARRGPEAPVEIPGIGRCLPSRSARIGIIAGLKALSLSSGSRVGVPLYCCPVVFKSIRAAGCTPVFIDVDPGTFCLSPADLSDKNPGLDAIIAVHMFGNVCDVPAVRDAMGGRPVIEDCAQSLGSRLYDRMAGALGDIAVFSFRLGKFLSVGEGGALYSGSSALMVRMSRWLERLPAPTPAEEFRHVAATYLRAKLRSRPLWGPVGRPLWTAYNRNTDFVSKTPIANGRGFATDSLTLARRLPMLDALIARQRSFAGQYLDNLSLDRSMLCHEGSGRFYNRFMFPIVFRSARECGTVSAYLLKRGISTARPYLDIAAEAAAHYGYEGDCPEAERLLERTLVIPNHHVLRRRDVARIVRTVNGAWAAVAQTA